MKKHILLGVLLFVYPAISWGQERNAFIDPTTGALKAVGYVSANGPGEIKIPVAHDFNLKPGEWRWDGKNWAALPTPTETANGELNELVFAIDNAVRSPLVTAEIKDVLLRLKAFLATK
ncbi:MAG TPA: hypothetical protein VJQ55_03975 [Candidatus Binatia bacterium]|nr:hypothetical protein [Candidatus Binatia bacterium]